MPKISENPDRRSFRQRLFLDRDKEHQEHDANIDRHTKEP